MHSDQPQQQSSQQQHPSQSQTRRRKTQQQTASNGLKILLLLVVAVVAWLSLESVPSLVETTNSDSNAAVTTPDADATADATASNMYDDDAGTTTSRTTSKTQRVTTSKSNNQRNNNRPTKPDKKKKKMKTKSSKSKSKARLSSSSASDSSSSSSSIIASSPKGIRQISILGERNSGTRWTWDHVSSCFNYSIPVVKELTRYKHWFQYNNSTLYPHDTLVLAQFRNPFDWLKAMQHVPHHAPMHYNLTWKEFLTKPWTMPRVGLDLHHSNHPLKPCQEDFLYKDIVSCAVEPLPKEAYDHVLRYSEHQPFYEMNMDGSGRPYETILHFRSDKILNMLSVRHYPGVRDVWILQYEYLLAKGTAHLIQMLQDHTGIVPKCKAFPRQYRPSRPVTKAFAKYVNRHLNWTTEAMIGYATDEKREEKWD